MVTASPVPGRNYFQRDLHTHCHSTPISFLLVSLCPAGSPSKTLFIYSEGTGWHPAYNNRNHECFLSALECLTFFSKHFLAFNLFKPQSGPVRWDDDNSILQIRKLPKIEAISSNPGNFTPKLTFSFAPLPSISVPNAGRAVG